MKTRKKLFTVTMITLLVIVSFIPSVFSWYSHNAVSEGNELSYHDDLPISVKSASSTISMSTVEADSHGTALNSTNVVKISVPTGQIKYYKTIFQNNGTNDVMIDLETKDMHNNADFVIGTLSPTLNEKAYASRATRSKVTNNTVRVYFKPNSGMTSYWAEDNGSLSTDNIFTSSNTSNNDINIGFTVNGTTEYHKMTKATDNDTYDDGGTRKVYYYDVPSNASSFFFFNHWYLRLGDNDNREWNCTIDITDLTAGRLYYLTGGKVDEKWKEYAIRTVNGRNVDETLVAVNSYYNNVRMSLGDSIFADIGLKRDNENDSEEFVPDYYGAEITYSSSDKNKVTVNKDGLLTPKASTTSGNVDTPVTITTTIKGRYNDTKTLTTKVSIPANISQVPIIKNVRIPAGESVEIDWYALNKSTTQEMTTDSIYYTL